MNDQLYATLGIDKNQDLTQILEELEEKQFEYLERSETVSDEARKKEIADILKEIDSEIAEVKEKKKNISSSLILDSEEENDSTTKAKEEENEHKEEKVSSKVEDLKKKTAEKQTKENEKKRKEAEKEAQKQQATQQQSNSTNNTTNSQQNAPAPAPIKQVTNTSSDITNGINSYNNLDYVAAFKVFKELSEKGDSSAQYLIAVMYINGLGINKDVDRALFWLKKSAESGEPAGRAAYGSILVSGNDAKDIKEGFKYLQIVSDAGDTDAMIDYVNACLNNKGSKKEISKAMDYCEKLKLATDDSFNKKKFDDAKQQLKLIKKNAGKNNGNSTTSNSSYSGTVKKKKHFPWKLIIVVIIAIVIFKACSANNSNSLLNNNQNQEEQSSEGTIRITVEDGNIRSDIGTDSEILGLAHLDEEYEYTGNSETASNGRVWYEIYLDEDHETTGWVSEKIAELE